MNRWAGPLIAALIIGGVGLILVMNLDMGAPAAASRKGAPSGIVSKPLIAIPESSSALAPRVKPKDFREYPIGDEVSANGMSIAAVWLPAVAMDGSGLSGSDIIHLEADVKATEGNPQGFALGEFIPYLKIHYEISPADGGPEAQRGELLPMIAIDGLHYGASVAMPKAGAYRLVYKIQPPSAGGLGRHSDPVTGVAPWWKPFDATFEWDYPGPPGTP